jgi:uncharacterized protein YbjT (DUF2867 family)
MILVTGAAGKTGLAVIRSLAARGVQVRGLIHQENYRSSVIEAGAESAILGDLLSEEDIRKAMEGIQAVYHIPPNVHPREVDIGRLVIQEAFRECVDHLVYHSVLHPQLEDMPHHWLKLRVEEQLIASGLPFTILQPTAYMQNISNQLENINREGVYEVPYSVNTRLCLVDLLDVAEVAAIVLTEGTHIGAVYQLVGTGLTSQDEIASLLSKLLGHEINAVQVSLEDWQEQVAESGLGSYQVSTLVKMFLHYQNHGFSGNPRMLHWLLGRQPTTLKECLSREIAQLKLD